MMIQNKIVLVTITAISIVSITIFAGMMTSQNEVYGQQAQILYPSRERTISVTGTATTSVLPDLVNIQFGVDTEAKTAQEAIAVNSETMNSVVSVVQNTGISKDEISTAQFSIYPIYEDIIPDPKTGIHKSVLTGYRASNILYVKTTKLSLSGNIIDAAVASGANRVNSISFSLSPAKQQNIQDDLLGKAVLNAKSRAEKALTPLEQKIIGVKLVSLSEFNIPPGPLYYGITASGAEYKSTPIFTSNQDVTTTANVIFLIGDQ